MELKSTEDTLSERPAVEQLKQLKYDYIHGDELIRIKNRRVIDSAEREDIQKEMRREIKRLLKSRGARRIK